MTFEKSDLISFGNFIDKRSHQKLKIEKLFDTWWSRREKYLTKNQKNKRGKEKTKRDFSIDWADDRSKASLKGSLDASTIEFLQKKQKRILIRIDSDRKEADRFLAILNTRTPQPQECSHYRTVEAKVDPSKRSYLDIDELSEYLGLGKSKLYELTYNRSLPAAKIGQQWRYRREEVDEWFSQLRAITKSRPRRR